jgi:cell division protein FtsI (penicillin-binding protein 3)
MAKGKRATSQKRTGARRGAHATVASSRPAHDPSYDFPNPTRRVAGSSSARKAMDVTRLRLFFMVLVFGLCFTGIGVRVVQIGLQGSVSHWQQAQAAVDDSSARATDVFFDEKPEQPKMMDALLGKDDAVPQQEIQAAVNAMNAVGRPSRGDIVDRNGVVVATSVQTQSLYADATVMRKFNVKEAVAKIHSVFPDLSRQHMQERIEKGRKFVYLKRHLSPQEQAAVMALGIPGLQMQPDARRVYPQGRLLSHVLGYVDIDNRGIAGIEKRMEERLTDSHLNQEPLALSLDIRVQHILRYEMQRAIKEFQAIGAAGVVMDARTGQIVAMSSLPDFDPNIPGRMSADAKFNRVSLGVYEMGSTFKTFTMAQALQFGTSDLTRTYDVVQPLRIGRFMIRDAHPEKRPLTLPEVFAYSSNIGTVRIVQGVGAQRQRDFLQKLGLFKPVDIELPERGLPLVPKDWREINMMTISYGHGISVTPLHLVRAIAGVTGTGRMPTLTLLKDGPEKRAESTEIVTPRVAMQMRKLMRLVVEHGTARKADAMGYEVGGKTGTAEKVKSGGYARRDKMASFVGVFPASDPKYVVLVMMDEPRGNKATYGYATGGWVAAPVVGRVVSRIGPLMGMKPRPAGQMEANVEPWLAQARESLKNAR